jgi:CheY-like chemotaxis protein
MLLHLRALGWPADLVANGREAMAALRRRDYGLVLLDQQMPEMDGLETTRAIRAAQAAGERGFPRDLRIVATTARVMPGDRERCLAAGMDDYLAKPVRTHELRAMLRRFLAPGQAAAPRDFSEESASTDGRLAEHDVLPAFTEWTGVSG